MGKKEYSVFNENCKVSTREAYGRALEKLGEKYENLIVLDADLSTATKTNLFKKKFPNRHINCGIAEANMTGIAAGLSLSGYIPFMSSFAVFATGRNFEQIRNSICYSHLNVKIAATHAGLTVGEDGGTHQCLEDIAIMRALPKMIVVVPCDENETYMAVEAAIKYYGPVYIRLGRPAVQNITNFESYYFKLGKGVLLKEGKDITIVATGLGVSIALIVAKLLEKNNCSAEVINIHTVKPIDKMLILNSAKKTRKVVTIEEHSIIGGLGDAVASVLVKKNVAKLLKIGVRDIFGFSGTPEFLLDEYKLSPMEVFDKIKIFFNLNIRNEYL